MEKVFEHNLGKDKALKLAKRAASGKFAIMKDEGYTFKVGAPMMTATITVTDTTITVSGGGAGGPVAQTIAGEIEMALEDANEKASASAPAAQSASAAPQQQSAPASEKQAASPLEYLDYQSKSIELLKQYKELFDSGILTEEEYNTQKSDILNFLRGMAGK